MITTKKLFFGFTMIELLVTVSIIVLMALVAVPTFSTYQKRSQFVQTTSEVSGLINQYGLLARNPELGATEYLVTAGISNIEFKKTISGATIVAKSYKLTDFGDATTITMSHSLRCETKTGDCFLDDTTVTTETKTKILTITDSRISKLVEYWVTDKPFSVELVIK